MVLDLQRNIEQFKQKLLKKAYNFEEMSLEAFMLQYKNNPIYQQFCTALKKTPSSIKNIEDIPFLPIEFYKNHKISCLQEDEKLIFTSSGTTGTNTSKNYVYDLEFYLQNCKSIFESSYGKLEDSIFLFLLPSYLEREGSSLVEMAQFFIDESKSDFSNFYLNNHLDLVQAINDLENSTKNIFLFGVSFGLLDFISFADQLTHHRFTIIETGGMKGRRKELTRTELHEVLKTNFKQKSIHSEYGMTELFSQAYSKGQGIFCQNNQLKVLVRDYKDPLSVKKTGRGGLNIIDLANIETCSFIATSDQGRVDYQTFEVLGRIDHSDSRGCNLMIS